MSLRVRLSAMSAFLDWDEGAALGADVVGAGTDPAVVVVLLDDVGGPAGDAAGCYDRREEIDRDAQRVEERGRVEIDVGDEALGFADAVMKLHRHLVP